MDKQKTIEKEVSIGGIGLHTANKVNITFKPAEIDTGINFVRTDLTGKPVIKASLENVSRSMRRTSISNGSAEIHTIEHLMAALSGLGIDNLYIEIDSDEVPGMDGSSLRFMEALTCVGIKEQAQERKYFVVKEPIFVEDAAVSIMAIPYEDFKISYTLDYSHSFLKTQFKELIINSDSFKQELSGARTFCLEEEAKELRQQGMGLGADHDNTLVVGEGGVIKNKLRYADEFVRHKIVDLIGDLYLLGFPVKGHIIALRSGHALNLKLVKKIGLLRQKNNMAGIALNYQPVKEGEQLDASMIMNILPHRDPFLFVDRIISLEKGKQAIGIKNVTINDYFFKGHFPAKPVMPGVLIIEAMAQVGGIMMLSPEENRGKLAYFMAINNVKFRKMVVPGDQLVFEVTAGKIKSRTGQVRGLALVEGRVVAEADLMFVLAEP